MKSIDWMQFETLAIICIGSYVLFEIIRLAVEQAIRVYGGGDTEKTLYNVSNLFSFLRIILIACIVVSFIFTAVFNRQMITSSHSDLGHKDNLESLNKIDTEALRARIEQKEKEFKESTLDEVNRGSEEKYEMFLKQNSTKQSSGGKE